MKKQLLILLFWVGFLNAQTYQNPTYGTVTVKSNVNDNSALKVNVQSASGAINTQAITSPIQTQFDALNATRVISGAGVTINADPTKFDIQVVGEIVNPTTFSRTPINKNVTGITATYLAAQTESYVWVDSIGTVIQSLTAPSPLIYDSIIGYWVIIHSNLISITLVNQFPMYSDGSAVQLHQLLDYIGFAKYAGTNIVSAGTTGTRLTHTGGFVIKNSGGGTTKRPVFSLTGATDATFQMRTQTGASGANTQSVDVNNIDIGGAITPLANNKFGACKIWKFSTSLIRVQYGQQEYATLDAAIAGIQTSSYVNDGNSQRNGLHIGWLIFKKGTSWGSGGAGVSGTDYLFVDVIGGKLAGNFVPTLQATYNISPVPQITTNSVNGAITIKRGSAADTDNILVGQNGAGTNTFSVTGAGNIVGGTYNGYTPENVANKSDSYTASSSTTYTSTKALVDGLATKQNTLTNPITGTGTANFLPKFTSSTTLGNSLFQDNGTGTSINGSISPNAVLAINVNPALSYGQTMTGTANQTLSHGYASFITANSGVTSSLNVFRSSPSTVATSFTLPNIYHFLAEQGTFGGGSTVTQQIGFEALSSLTGAGTNYGFRGDIPAATNNWNVYMAGSAKNYFNGRTLIGSSTDDGTNQLQVTGSGIFSQFLTVNAKPIVSGNYTTSINTVVGANLQINARTVTNSGAASSSTTPHYTAVSLDPPTFSATNTSVTYTNASNLYIGGAPIAGTNITITNPWSVYVNSGNSFFGGNVIANQFRLSTLNTAPASSSDTGTTGEIRIVNGFIYVCVASNTWQRATLSTF